MLSQELKKAIEDAAVSAHNLKVVNNPTSYDVKVALATLFTYIKELKTKGEIPIGLSGDFTIIYHNILKTL